MTFVIAIHGPRHLAWCYVLIGVNYCPATCVAEYLDNDSDEVLPLIKRILDSVRAIDPRR